METWLSIQCKTHVAACFVAPVFSITESSAFCMFAGYAELDDPVSATTATTAATTVTATTPPMMRCFFLS